MGNPGEGGLASCSLSHFISLSFSLVLNHLVGNPEEGCLAWCCRVKLNWLQTTWWVTLEREVWHGAVTTLPPKLIVTSMLAKTEVRASVLCVQYFIVFNMSTVMVLPLPCC